MNKEDETNGKWNSSSASSWGDAISGKERRFFVGGIFLGIALGLATGSMLWGH